MSRTKQSGRPTPNVFISEAEAGDLLQIAADIAFSHPDRSLLLQRIAKDALRKYRPKGTDFERDHWLTVYYLLSGDSVKDVIRRWGWNFTAKRASQLKPDADQTISTTQDALTIAEFWLNQYREAEEERRYSQVTPLPPTET